MSSGARLRVIFFGTGGLVSGASLRAIAADHDVLAVVRPVRQGWAHHVAGRVARRLGLRAEDPLGAAARAVRAPQWPVTSLRDDRFAARVAKARPDLVCVAQFPWRLPDPVLATASLGGVNLHPSLLPRHRGPLPHFWIYHADDRETGVTVHHMTREFDSGDVLGQRSFPLTRGFPVDELNAANARIGPELLRETVNALARGTVTRQAQDDSRATQAPMVKRGSKMVDFEGWDVERVWHFLAGLWPRFTEPLTDDEGRRVSYGGVLGYERYESGGADAAGSVVAAPDADRLALRCNGGVVLLRATAGTGHQSTTRTGSR